MERCLKTLKIGIATSFLVFAGCASCPPHSDFQLPLRPHLSEFTPEEWQALPQSVREKIVSDDLNMKQYILQAEARARNHNET